jgi:hypothetical protein
VHLHKSFVALRHQAIGGGGCSPACEQHASD